MVLSSAEGRSEPVVGRVPEAEAEQRPCRWGRGVDCGAGHRTVGYWSKPGVTWGFGRFSDVRRLRSHLNYANVMATVAMFVALGGGAYAVSSVPDNSGRLEQFFAEI